MRKLKQTGKNKTRTPRDIFLGSIILIFGVGILVIGSIFIFYQTNSSAATKFPAEISVAESFDLYQTGTIFVDVRENSEWQEYHIPNTIHIPLGELEKRAKELPKDKNIVVVCRSGNRSMVGRNILLERGFNQVTSMAGGVKEWQSAGYPIVTGK